VKVAVSGKGGVGKTFIAAALASFFVKKGFKVLAVDADPSPNLALMLGVPLSQASTIKPLSEDWELIESKTSTGYPGVYRLSFSVDDVVDRYAVKTPTGVYLLVMGTVKDAGGGCTCPANALIRALMRHLIVDRSEAVVMDMEAGVEHLGRGTAKYVEHMLIVTEPSFRSMDVAKKIYGLTLSLKVPKAYLVGNKVVEDRDVEAITSFAKDVGVPLLGLVPYDEGVAKAERTGQNPLLVEGVAVKAIRGIGEKLLTGLL